MLIVALFGVIIATLAAQTLIENNYPQDLTFTYENGTLTSNQQLPISTSFIGYAVTLTDKALVLGSAPMETYTAQYTELLADIPPFQVQKDTAKQFVPTVIPAFGGMFVVTVVIMMMVIRLPLLLLYSLVIQSVLSLVGRKLPYAVLLQLGLHAAVVAEILNIVYLLTYRTRNFPMYDVVFFGIMIWVLRSRRVQIVQIGSR